MLGWFGLDREVFITVSIILIFAHLYMNKQNIQVYFFGHYANTSSKTIIKYMNLLIFESVSCENDKDRC